VGIVVAVAFNIAFGLSSVSDIPRVHRDRGRRFTALPFVVVGETAGVGGSLYSGAIGFFPLIVLTLLIVSMAQIMIRGGGFGDPGIPAQFRRDQRPPRRADDDGPRHGDD